MDQEGFYKDCRDCFVSSRTTVATGKVTKKGICFRSVFFQRFRNFKVLLYPYCRDLYVSLTMIDLSTLETIDFDHFLKVGLVVGTIVSAQENPKARKPAYVLQIDFGTLGIKSSSAQITENYSAHELIGRQVVAVVNFPSKRVAGIKSEVLVLAAVCEEKGTVLLSPTIEVSNGTRIL